MGEADKNGKESQDVAVEEAVHQRIVTQLEYYFSDVNLSRDKFMQQQVRLDEGWVPLDLLLKFKRLAAILGERDKSVIVDAVRKSNLLEVNDEEDKVRRGEGLPEGYDDLRKELMTRTVYCKGFPLEGVTFDELLEFFKTFGKIDSVIMRHYMDRATKERGFKGSVFVIFPTKKEAEDFLALEEVKFKDAPLIRKWQMDYVDGKRQERLDDRLKRQQRRRENKKGGKKGAKGTESEAKKSEGGGGEERSGFPLGTVLHFTGLEEGTKVHRDTIRETVETLGFSVGFIEFNKGDTFGYIRLDQANTAPQLMEKLPEGKMKVGEEEVEIRALQGEEETNFLDRTRKEMNKKRGQHGKRKHRGRGGYFGDRKRKGESQEGGPPAKMAKD